MAKQNIPKAVEKKAAEIAVKEPEKIPASVEERKKTAESVAEDLYSDSKEKVDESFESLGKLISHIIKLLQAIFSGKAFEKAFSNETVEATGKKDKEELKNISDKGAKLREIWPETRVPERYWINLADGIDRRTELPKGQSFGPFQFYRNTFTDFMKYVRKVEPKRWESLSPTVKRKIETQTEIFSKKRSKAPLTRNEINRSFLNMKEAGELIAKVFKPPDLAYNYRSGQFFDRKLPRIARSVSRSFPEYKNTVEKLKNDKRYLAAVFDLSNQLGPGGAINVIKNALKDIKTKGINTPSFNEMFVSLVKASYRIYGFKRAARTLGALAMACGQTGGKMDRKKMSALINNFIASPENQKENIIEQAKRGIFA